jgi:tetratricopeptide (TPR) repeat protein
MQISGRKLLAATGTVAILLGAGAAFADVKAGVDRWMAGDFNAAVAEWRPLADKGDADAQFNLGQAYKLGKGVPMDLKVAQSWYQKAAQQGHQQAQVNVGLLLYNSGRRQEALPWLRKAVELGDPRAQYILGTELFNGDLVAKDWPRAYALMLLAADKGLAPAADNIKAMDKYVPLQQRQQGVQLAQKFGHGGPVQTAAAQPARSAAPAPRTASPVVTQIRPAAVPAPSRPAAGGGWRVQLGAFSSAANAQRAWATLRGKAGALGSLQPQYVSAGAVTRLQAGPVPSRDAANRVCAAAKAAGSACFPVAP